MAEAIAVEKKWSSLSCLSVDVFALLDEFESKDKQEDEKWLENALA
jgi:hypothetical protein